MALWIIFLWFTFTRTALSFVIPGHSLRLIRPSSSIDALSQNLHSPKSSKNRLHSTRKNNVDYSTQNWADLGGTFEDYSNSLSMTPVQQQENVEEELALYHDARKKRRPLQNLLQMVQKVSKYYTKKTKKKGTLIFVRGVRCIYLYLISFYSAWICFSFLIIYLCIGWKWIQSKVFIYGLAQSGYYYHWCRTNGTCCSVCALFSMDSFIQISYCVHVYIIILCLSNGSDLS